MGIITAIISCILCGILYVRMIRREVPEPITKKQAIIPPVLGFFAPFLSTLLAMLFGVLTLKVLGGPLSEKVSSPLPRSLLSSFFVAGFPEEFVKCLLILLAVKLVKPKNVYEYALIGAGVGFGFTALEEVLYSGNVLTALFRMPAFALHMIMSLIMALFLGLARHFKSRGLPAGKYTFLGLFLPVLWHTVFDASTANSVWLKAEDDAMNVTGIVIALVVVVISVVLQFVLLWRFKKNTEKYCAMAL